MQYPKRCIRFAWPSLLLPTLWLALLAGPTAAQTPEETRMLAKLKSDCQLEGEGGGLSGTDLDHYIDQCVRDLLEVEILHSTDGK